MGRRVRSRRVYPIAAAAAAFAISAAAFAGMAAVVPLRGSIAIVVIWCLVCAGGVGLAAWRLGPLFGVPLGLAAAVAVDSFYIAPYRAFDARDWVNYLVTAMYIAIGVFVGSILEVAHRRAATSETARGKLAAEVEELAEEQASLRRVATLVAQGVPPPELFSAISEEIGRLFGSDQAAVVRLEPQGSDHVVMGLARVFEGVTVGSRWELDESMATAQALRTGRSARIDNFDASGVSGRFGETVRRLATSSSVASPIIVGGHVWGAVVVSAKTPLPSGAERRLEKFTELAATAVANVEAREALTQLADEQAALRRVAEFVAREAPHTEIFTAIAEEIGKLLGTDEMRMVRYESDGEAVIIARAGTQDIFAVGSRWPLRGDNVTARVFRTRRQARIDDYRGSGPISDDVRAAGIRAVVGTPIVVQGNLWGAMLAATVSGEPLPPDTESRLSEFTELMATSIANAEARSELAASRARLVVAGDEVRRQIERNLHDGVQQRLVSLALRLRRAERRVPPEQRAVRLALSETVEQLNEATDEVREIAHGIHPAILTQGGLAPALRTLALRGSVPVEVVMRGEDRLPEPLEAAAYYVVAEALTNAAKHAAASKVTVAVERHDGLLHLRISDDGVGGADPSTGSGLTGIRDRVEALGGSLAVQSPRGQGTALDVVLPGVDPADPPEASG